MGGVGITRIVLMIMAVSLELIRNLKVDISKCIERKTWPAATS